MPAPWFTGLTDNGYPVTGGKLYVYLAGTSTPAVTYTDVNLTVPHPFPIILDGGGRASVYLITTQAYKFVLKDEFDVTIRTQDDIIPTPTLASNVDVGGIAGEQFVSGQVVYLSDGSGAKIAGRWYLADGDFPYASSLPQIGMAPDNVTSAATGLIRMIGRVDVPYTVVPGATYYVSNAPGEVSLTPGANARFLGVADSASSIVISPDPPPAPAGVITPPYVYTYEIISLVEADPVTVDCDASHMDGTKWFQLAANANRVIAQTTNAKAGMRMIIAHLAVGADRTLSLTPGAGGGFRFGSDITGLTPTVNGKTDFIGSIYNSASGVWEVVAYMKGY